MDAVVPRFACQPLIFPVWLSKMKRAGPGVGVGAGPEFGTTKSLPPLKTMPVGSPPGMVIVCKPALRTNGLPDTSPLKSCVVLVPLLAIQKGLLADVVMPQGLTSRGSWMNPRPGISETKFVWRYAAPGAITVISGRTPPCACVEVRGTTGSMQI